ncbi:triose-phosphate isomerase [Candidatus Woesearchaeota archaeon]|nr:triose-phosphate isomerase [Candidatus Woesearchaeota archaeon]
MRKPMIAANWKMHMTSAEAGSYVTDLIKRVKDISRTEIVLCPPFTALGTVDQMIAHSNIKLGAQNMYPAEKGAITGEISPLMLKDIGCSYVILGHSERRSIFGETDEDVNKKARMAMECRLLPIICIGETLEQKKAGDTERVIASQLKGCLTGIGDMEGVVIAYEPVWAISGGDPDIKPATPEEAQKIHSRIRSVIQEIYDKDTAESVLILYGGSMKPENAADLLAQPDIDGGLVGSASLKPESFEPIITAAEKSQE